MRTAWRPGDVPYLGRQKLTRFGGESEARSAQSRYLYPGRNGKFEAYRCLSLHADNRRAARAAETEMDATFQPGIPFEVART